MLYERWINEVSGGLSAIRTLHLIGRRMFATQPQPSFCALILDRLLLIVLEKGGFFDCSHDSRVLRCYVTRGTISFGGRTSVQSISPCRPTFWKKPQTNDTHDSGFKDHNRLVETTFLPSSTRLPRQSAALLTKRADPDKVTIYPRPSCSIRLLSVTKKRLQP